MCRLFFIFGLIILIICLLLVMLVYCFLNIQQNNTTLEQQHKEKFKTTNVCQYTENTCGQQCQVTTKRRTVLYTYHLYPVGQTPSSEQLDPSDVKKRLQDVIDSGYMYVILSFYEYPISQKLDTNGAFGIFMSMTDDVKKEIFDYARQKNVKLFFSIGGADGSISLRSGTADEITTDIVDIFKKNAFDGVDIDVEDSTQFMKMADVTNKLASQFKTLFPNTKKEISHAPASANFGGNTGQPTDYFTVYATAGENIDFFNVQFYNQGCTHDSYQKLFEPDDNSCQNIAWISTGHKMGSTYYGSVIPLNKLLIGKPICLWTQPQNCPYGAGNGYVDPTLLKTYFDRARQEMAWDAGLMIWEYNPENKTQATQYLKKVYQ